VKRAGSNICIADTDQYSIIDTKAATILPFHPISVDPVLKVLPQMSVASRDEYFCVTYNTPSSIGVFINNAGDPSRPPFIKWDGHPESVCIDDDLLVSSMPNRQVQVYNIASGDLSQTIKLPSSVTVPPILALSQVGFSAPVNQRKQTLQRLSITVPPTNTPKPPSPVARKDPDEPSSSGLTPPPTPVRPATNAPQTHGGAHRPLSQFPKAHVIVFGPDCVYALLPSTIISQADGLIDSGKVQDAAYLVAQAQKKLAARPGGEGDMVRS
jgi:vacuolar protein sorting-associated protein 3